MKGIIWDVGGTLLVRRMLEEEVLQQALRETGLRSGVAPGRPAAVRQALGEAQLRWRTPVEEREGTGCDVPVFGHSHAAYNQWHGTTLAVNPGSPTDRRRWSPGLSYGLLHLEPQGVRAELRFLGGDD